MRRVESNLPVLSDIGRFFPTIRKAIKHEIFSICNACLAPETSPLRTPWKMVPLDAAACIGRVMRLLRRLEKHGLARKNPY